MINRLMTKFFSPRSAQEKSRLELLKIKLSKSDIAIDCGANVGSVTTKLCRSGAMVYAFEPNPYAFAVLRKAVSSNKNVHCFQKGVYDKNGTMKLFLHENSDQDEVTWSTGSSFLDYKGNVLEDKFVEVEIIDLCEFIVSLNSRIKILKMDVEGVECRILRKMINSGIIHKVDHVFVETHDQKMPELKKETAELREIIDNNGIRNINLDWA